MPFVLLLLRYQFSCHFVDHLRCGHCTPRLGHSVPKFGVRFTAGSAFISIRILFKFSSLSHQCLLLWRLCHIRLYLYTYIHELVRVHINISIRVCVYVCMCVCVCVCVPAHVCDYLCAL